MNFLPLQMMPCKTFIGVLTIVDDVDDDWSQSINKKADFQEQVVEMTHGLNLLIVHVCEGRFHLSFDCAHLKASGQIIRLRILSSR